MKKYFKDFQCVAGSVLHNSRQSLAWPCNAVHQPNCVIQFGWHEKVARNGQDFCQVSQVETWLDRVSRKCADLVKAFLATQLVAFFLCWGAWRSEAIYSGYDLLAEGGCGACEQRPTGLAHMQSKLPRAKVMWVYSKSWRSP